MIDIYNNKKRIVLPALLLALLYTHTHTHTFGLEVKCGCKVTEVLTKILLVAMAKMIFSDSVDVVG
jgi:hypothetical protein